MMRTFLQTRCLDWDVVDGDNMASFLGEYIFAGITTKALLLGSVVRF